MNPAEHQVGLVEQDVRIERRKSNAGNTKSPRKSDKQPSAHGHRGHASLPQLNTSHQRENHTHFGLSTPTSRAAPPIVSQPLTIRPRAITAQTYPSRPPASYVQQQPSGYNNGPPLSMSAYYQPPPGPQPSYPPPSPSSYQRYGMAPSQGDYFTPQAISRPLSSRFDPIARTQSAFGSHPQQSSYDPVPRTASAFGTREVESRALDVYDGGYYDDGYSSQAESMSIRKRDRRDSIRVPSSAWSKEELDIRAMPPPARPSILRRAPTEYTRQPSPSEYTIEPLDTPGSYDASRTRYHEEPPRARHRRPSHHRHSLSYDLGPEMVTVEAANSSRRRQSFYEKPPSTTTTTTTGSSGYEDKLNKAATYQEDVAGGPTVRLTADMLKKQQRRQAGSSRSTKSSASRDESDYKKSATTRTTRSSSGNNEDENVTIKVTGQARVMVGNTSIDCTDGGQIEISHQQKNFRDGRSERSNSEFAGPPRFDDRPSRAERPTLGRTRVGSQTGQSYMRPHSHYTMEEYENSY